MLVLTACATNKPFTLELMPTPDIYTGDDSDPFENPQNLDPGIYDGILYMTNRLPAPEDKKEKHYVGERGNTIRVGASEITYSGKSLNSQELRKVSILKNRTDKYPLQVTKVDEIGYLESALPRGDVPDVSELGSAEVADSRFADLINKKLSVSDQKELFIFVHGYRSVFDDPLLLSSELWHFMGYDGVFIAFAWHSVADPLSYFKASEGAQASGHDLRVAIEYLSKNTNAERINIIGYSAGTRVTLTALHQLALKKSGARESGTTLKTKIGQVALIGSDYNRDLFGNAVTDGLSEVVDNMTVYMSQTDKAMGISNFLFGNRRLGQLADTEIVSDATFDWLRENQTISFVNVTDAEKSGSGNGHAYFRKSPWASSDLLLLMKSGLGPSERGLVLRDDETTWSFSADYPERMRAAVRKLNTTSQPALN